MRCKAGTGRTAAGSSGPAARSRSHPRRPARRSADSLSAGLADARERLRRARLYLVVEAAAEHVLPGALRGGVDMVQLRDKGADDEAILRAAARFRSICDEQGALLWLNDRPDLALDAEVDGVHVGQDDLPVAVVREQVGDALLIGLSTHSPEQFDAAVRSEADQLSVGPVVAAGARRIVVVRAIRDAADPEAAAAVLRAALEPA